MMNFEYYFSHFVRQPKARFGMLHQHRAVAVLNNRSSDDFQIFVFQYDFLIVFFLTKTKRGRRGGCLFSKTGVEDICFKNLIEVISQGIEPVLGFTRPRVTITFSVSLDGGEKNLTISHCLKKVITFLGGGGAMWGFRRWPDHDIVTAMAGGRYQRGLT